MKVAAVVPMKLNNRRLPQKNAKPFTNGRPLCWYILSTLLEVEAIEKVYVYCSNPSIQEYMPQGVATARRPSSTMPSGLRGTAIMNRVNPQGEEHRRNVLTFEGLSIDLDARIVTVDGQRVELSPKEYDLLVYMAQNKNIALTREMLITNVWGYDFYGDDRTLDTHIKLLRRSLGPYSKFIVTLRGVGYRFEGK